MAAPAARTITPDGGVYGPDWCGASAASKSRLLVASSGVLVASSALRTIVPLGASYGSPSPYTTVELAMNGTLTSVLAAVSVGV